MNFPHSKTFVSNDLTKGDQKCSEEMLSQQKKYIFSSTREIQKKTEEKLSASLVCISLMRICSFTTLMNKIIYSVQTLPQLQSVQIYSLFSLSKGFLKFTSTPPTSLSPYSHSPITSIPFQPPNITLILQSILL